MGSMGMSRGDGRARAVLRVLLVHFGRVGLDLGVATHDGKDEFAYTQQIADIAKDDLKVCTEDARKMIRLREILLGRANDAQDDRLEFAPQKLLDIRLGTFLHKQVKVWLNGERRLEVAAILLQKVKVDGGAAARPLGIAQKGLSARDELASDSASMKPMRTGCIVRSHPSLSGPSS